MPHSVPADAYINPTYTVVSSVNTAQITTSTQDGNHEDLNNCASDSTNDYLQENTVRTSFTCGCESPKLSFQTDSCQNSPIANKVQEAVQDYENSHV